MISTVFRASAMTLALTAFFATLPVTVEAGSRSRHDGRNVATSESSEAFVTRGKSRRASRASGYAEGETTVARKKVRRGKSFGGAADAVNLATVLTESTEVWDAAGTTQAALDKHIADQNFDGVAGALAMFQLVNKAAAKMTLTGTEQRAFDALTAETPMEQIMSTASDRVLAVAEIDATEAEELLATISAALGVERVQTIASQSDETS